MLIINNSVTYNTLGPCPMELSPKQGWQCLCWQYGNIGNIPNIDNIAWAVVMLPI